MPNTFGNPNNVDQSLNQTMRRFSVAALSITLFAIPFGHLQNAVFDGLTVAKLLIPLLFLILAINLRNEFRIHPYLWCYVAFVVMTTPSLVMSANYPTILLSLSGYILLFQVIYNGLNTMDSLKLIFTYYVIGLCSVSAATILALFTGVDLGQLIALPMIDNWYGLPIFLGTSGNPNGFATLFVVGVPLAWMLYLTADNTLIRVLSLFAMTVISFTLIMTFSRSATAAAVIATVLLHHFYNHNSIFSYRFFAKMAITFIFLYWYFKFPYFTLMAVASGETDIATIVSDLFQNRSRHIAANSVPANSIQANKAISGGYRLLVLEYQLSAFLSNPFFGMGYGNFSNYLNNAIGLKVGPHNVFSGIAIEYGALALAFFIGLLALGSHNIIRYINKSPTKNSKMVAASVLAGLGGLLFHGLFHEIYINFTLWFFIATAGVVHKLKVA